MKNLVKLFTLLLAFAAAQNLYAQNEQDAVRYGYTPLSGSARYIGMGGAFNALGGDVSAISSNPAATSVFLSNELAIALGFNANSSTTTYLGKSVGNLETRIVIPAFGVVLSNTVRNQASPWKSINLSYSYNRVKDFYSVSNYRGTSASSLADQLVSDANGIVVGDLADVAPLTSDVAFQTYLIDSVPGTTDQYFSHVGAGMVNQNYTTTTKGRMGDNTFSFGANYDNKLYLGAAFTITSVSFSLSEVYREETVDKSPGTITDFTYRYDLSTQGAGYNFKVGAIYRIAETLRFGLSLQTPTTYILSDQFSSNASTNFQEDSAYSFSSNEYQMQYNLVIPARIGFGAAYLFGKKGLISFDYNRQDFSRAKYKNQVSTIDNPDNNYDFGPNNESIVRFLGPTNQFKVGGEYKINRLSLRAGYGYQDSPYKTSVRIKATSSSSISLGLGYNFDSVSLDFGLCNTSYTDDYFPYSIAEPASVKTGVTSGNVTIVFRY